jgi:CRP/FNR family transcriptional regulator, dissimilatory nitrate respiration regulator
MRNKSNIIASVPLFRGLPHDQVDELSAISVARDVKNGEIIFTEGEDADGFYVVVTGKVKIYKMSLDGKEKILHIFDPPEPFGEVPVFTGMKFPAYAQAILKSRLLFFPRDAFIRVVSDNPSLGLNMLGVLSARLRQFAAQIEYLSLKEVPARLASYLILLSEEHNGNTDVTLPISKGQLASLLGTIPETLSRILSKMSNRQLIEVDGRRIRLVDPQGINALAENGKLLDP